MDVHGALFLKLLLFMVLLFPLFLVNKCVSIVIELTNFNVYEFSREKS